MTKYPQEPKEWDDANNTLYRQFKFNSTPDIECLMRLVKENIPNQGNNSYLRARLLGILGSMYSDANARFFIRRENPKTWKIRLLIRKMRRLYHRTFKTKHFKGQVQLCNIARDVVKRMEK